MISIKQPLNQSLLALFFALTLPLAAQTTPETAELLTPASTNITSFKTEHNPTLSIVDTENSKTLRVEFPASKSYPGFNIPVPTGGWNLSTYAGIEAEIVNTSTSRLNISMRAENNGDWEKEPWNSNNVWIAPGDSKRLQVTFGQSFGQAGYPLNSGAISAVKLFVSKPNESGSILIKSIEGFGKGTPTSTPAAATTAPAASITAKSGSPIFVPTADNISAIKTEGNPMLSVEGSALKLVFPNDDNYPGIDFPLPGGQIDLSKFAGVQAEITNTGNSRLNVALRVANPGDWRKEPWNTGNSWIDAGQTMPVKVIFGQSHGHSGYALDRSKVNYIKLYVSNPKADASILVRNLVPFGSGDSATTSAATKPTAIGVDATFSPSIDGNLLDLKKNGLSGFNFSESSAVLVDGKIKATFNKAKGYPNIQFPIPSGGWNLSAFGGIQVTVTNPGNSKLKVSMRVDNPGAWKDEPWNTENLLIDAGESKTLNLTFGQQNGAPAYPLKSARIKAIQVFVARPKADTTLILSDLRASGSPADAANELSFTKPEDRNIPAVLPEWLGGRPPVEGDWVLTLDENFDGDTLDESLWSPRFPWDGPQPGQKQRYAPENVIIGDGVATFIVEKRFGHENNDPKLDTREYTSGLIQTYDKWAQLYGYFEARIKVPYVRGLWPAYWMMPDRGEESGLDEWQRRHTGNGAMEIDIMEILSEWGPGRNSVATHWDGYGPEHKQWGTSQIYYGPTEDGYHVYGLLWEPGKLTWYVDGKKVAEQISERVSNAPATLRFNVQIGGWATNDTDDANLPVSMEVDYTRAWQLKSRL
ncbi:glycoside hydrolase family 16 protein [Cerasicoccus arenae]|uniref:GH16 domain-containing protein n=1 Tax=Cerasicoccus arenae TaxID=424488 RepID=A0A8J3DCK3_9BACT|nr:glycoside hydrolase family 16 protein [Cerasicoccus arenae]MBK1858355.1 glycoside hydrolase family 16 protein [Cerasicoccus arenae]GHC09771.1 hypothetical protein GCM10007047_28840 [Cerasicoccus arenae]